MIDSLKEIMEKEFGALTSLSEKLEEQHSAYIKKDIFALEAVVEKISSANVEVAKCELERRKLIGNKSMKQLVFSQNDKELTECFNKLAELIKKLQVQKETNEFLIKEGLKFTNRMLNIFRPNKGTNTYNSYGKLLR